MEEWGLVMEAGDHSQVVGEVGERGGEARQG